MKLKPFAIGATLMIVSLINSSCGDDNETKPQQPTDPVEQAEEQNYLVYADPFRDDIFIRNFAKIEDEETLLTEEQWDGLGGDVADFDYLPESNKILISQLSLGRILLVDNGEVTVLYPTEKAGHVRGIIADPETGDVYWVDKDSKSLKKGNIDGRDPVVLVDGTVETCYDLYIHSYDGVTKFLYYHDFSNTPENQGIWELELTEGSDPVRYFEGKIRSFTLDLPYVYFSIDQNIYYSLIGYPPYPFATGANKVYGLTLDKENELLYWSERGGDQDDPGNIIVYTPITGDNVGQKQTLVEGIHSYSMFLEKK